MIDYAPIINKFLVPLNEAIQEYQLVMKQEGIRVNVKYEAHFNREDLDNYAEKKTPKVVSN